ncbi:MAG: hypothetical protein ACK4IX_14635 [Candidatus Sericytochromatia bacterium]
MLVIIDVNSRYVQAKPLTNRRNETILESIKMIFDKMGKPKVLNCDNEFNTKLLNDYFESNNITVHYNQPYEINKNAIVERFNRTIAMMLTRWRETTKLKTWYSVLDELVDAYHRTIKNKPIEVWNGTIDNKQTLYLLIMI